MGKSKKITREGFKILLLSSLHLLIFEIICIILELIANIGIKATGGEDNANFIALTEYEIVPFFVIVSGILFLIVFTVFYLKYFKNDIKKIFKLHWLFIILFILIYLLLGFCGFIAFLLVSLFNVGLFGAVVNHPVLLYYIIIIYVFGFIAIDIIYNIVVFLKNRKK